MGGVFPALVLVALVVLAGFSARTGVLGALALAFVSLLWLLVNGGMEGDVLWSFDPDHGLTSADLASVAGLGLAAYRGVRGVHAELSRWNEPVQPAPRPRRDPEPRA